MHYAETENTLSLDFAFSIGREALLVEGTVGF